MGRPRADSSPESGIEIKVHPHRSNQNPAGETPSRHHQRTPPRPYQPFKKWVAWLVPTIFVVNIALFVFVMYANDCPRTSNNCLGEEPLGRFAFQSFSENPLLGPRPNTLEKLGGLKVDKVVENHEAWRLITSMWLHMGFFHLLANMISLLLVGIKLEQEFGFVRIGLLYVLSGFGGSLCSALFVRMQISVGASGALFGLLGAMLSELFTNWTIYENKLSALSTLILIITINLAVGILPHVDNFAHLGGFCTGFLLGFVLFVRPQYGYVSRRNLPRGYSAPPTKSKYKAYQCVFLLVSLILLIGGFTTGLLLLVRGVNGNEYCSWCHFLRCVPTPLWNCDDQNSGSCIITDCKATVLGKQVNMTCPSSHKSGSYSLQSMDNSKMQKLCSQLCC